MFPFRIQYFQKEIVKPPFYRMRDDVLKVQDHASYKYILIIFSHVAVNIFYLDGIVSLKTSKGVDNHMILFDIKCCKQYSLEIIFTFPSHSE